MAYKLAEEQRSWNKNIHEATPGTQVLDLFVAWRKSR